MPLAFGLCSLSFIDRSNIENTKIAGMKDDIDLSGRRYDWLATAFYGLRAMYGHEVPLYLSYLIPRQRLGLSTGISLSGAASANEYGSALATARFFSEREQDIAFALSLRHLRGRETNGLQLKQIMGYLLDHTTLMYFGCKVCFASLPQFTLTIMSQMGAFTSFHPNGLSAPPYVLCWIAIVACAILSRSPTQATVAARYLGLFLATQLFVFVTLSLTWIGNTHATDSKRAGTIIFHNSDKRYYRIRMWISCCACLIVVVMGRCQMLVMAGEPASGQGVAAEWG
ncbi:hypothetical protein ASPCADRAFT_518944 [Aspergillus carbonarius ITEM 5010]|uniref:Uncharacterized protein n=1 Tax=Aspergillus carbonarius (strain ITEM 5010) TaxID=602072 RepID=A0A1R3R8G8_ASPC5|nr:hypothetical protein ASPCADRAFT_518944 [Aspergillus carbonarius ITEM 5010]